MKKKIFIFLGLFLMLIGIAFALYPPVCNILFKYHTNRVLENYTTKVNKTKDYQEIYEKAKSYNQRLYDHFDDLSDYDEILNINNDGIMGYVEIPAVNIKLPIYHGTSMKVLEKGIGHYQFSSLPIGGENTHSLLFGHTGLPNASLLTDINRLKIGDVFYIFYLDTKLTYEVDNISVVKPEKLKEFKIEAGDNYVTLVTCTPYGVNSHRLLVRGKYINKTKS